MKIEKPDHLFISETDGGIYDTRKEEWHLKPIRANYRKTYSQIKNVNQLKSTLRNGSYTWPGGYPLFFVTSDGEALHFDCVLDNFRSVVDSVRNSIHDGWQVIGCEVNYESELYCDHCSEQIESAYLD